MSDPTEPRDDSDRLAPCPFCGSEAEGMTMPSEPENIDSGAMFVQCTNSRCMASSALIYPLGDDPKPLLLERWNRRSASRQEGWQSIETAPKDGTHILVSWPMRQMDDEDMPTGPITRRDTLVTWMNGDAWIEPDYLNASGAWYGDEDCYAADPDLWMPLPTPPRSES